MLNNGGHFLKVSHHFHIHNCWLTYTLNKLIENKNIINYIKAQRLAWFGHVYRMPDDRMVKKVYEWKSMSTRSLGWPKNRWEDDVKNDLKNMRTNNWRDCIRNQHKWKVFIEKAKTSNFWSCNASWRRWRLTNISSKFADFFII